MSFISNCFKGIAIGMGAILPGVSSGVLCVIFGIYEKLLNSVLGFFKDIKGNLKFLTPIFIGVFIGIIIFSNVVEYFFYKFPLQTKSIFIGLILGSIPSLFSEVNKNYPFKIKYLFFSIIAILIGMLTVYLERIGDFSSVSNINFIYLFVSGFLMSIGVVVPGVSSTIILMLLRCI